MSQRCEPWRDQSAADALPRERRASVRYPCPASPPALVRTENEVCLPARVVNVSQTGIGLLLAEPVPGGTILGLELHARAQELPYFLLARVVHLQEQPDGQWLLGCQLTGRLPAGELAALL